MTVPPLLTHSPVVSPYPVLFPEGWGLGRRQASDSLSSHGKISPALGVKGVCGFVPFCSCFILPIVQWVESSTHTNTHTCATNQNEHQFSRQCGLNYKEEKCPGLLCNLHRSAVTMTSVTHNTSKGPVGSFLHPLLSVGIPSGFPASNKKKTQS